MIRMRCTALALAAGIALGIGFNFGPAARSADAQMRMFGGMGRGGFGAERVTSGEVTQFGQILNLDKTQKSALDDLFKAYDAGYEEASKAYQDKIEKIRQDFQDSQDPSVWQKDMPEATEKFQKKATDLEKSFLGDLKDLLTGDQQTRWASLERAHRRNQSLGGGASIPGFGLAGEGVDLIKLVDELKLAKKSEPLTQSLDRYESEMDQAIVERDAKRKELGEQMQNGAKQAGGGGMPDFGKIQEMLKEMRKSGIKVRDVNERYSSLLSAALPDDKREKFDDSYRKAKFPQIYKEPYPIKALNAAKGFKDLDDTQKSGVAELTAKYTREVDGLNDKWAKAQADAEKDGGGDDPMGGWMKMMNGDQGGDESDLAKARKARRDLDRDTMDKLKALLNEDQQTRLPERDNAGMFQFGGGGRR